MTLLTRLDSTNESIAKSLITINEKLDKIADEINQKINRLDNRLWFLYAWTGAGFVGLFTIIAKGFGWY
jgi:hypothetical protein